MTGVTIWPYGSGSMPSVTISDGDAAELRQLQAAYQQAVQTTDEARAAYYRKVVAIADGGGTQEEIAAVLGVHRSRVGQLLDQARRALDR